MNYSLLAPEMLIALTGLILLISGLILAGRGQRIVGIISVSLLVAVLLLVVIRFTESAVFFNGVYQVDTFANFFKALFLIAAILVMLSAGKYTERFEQKQSEFHALMVFATLGMMVMAAAGDLITIYIGLELMTVSFYILTAYLLNDEASSEAGLKYLILGAISSAILLFGMSLVFALSGTTVISEIAGQITRQPALIAGITLMIVGFGFKIAVVPFHMWAPDIYQGAPIPVTTYLAAGSKAAAFAALLRIFMIALPFSQFNWSLVMAILAAITIIVGNLIALNQTNVKRMLAYSSIAQAGYILAGLVAANAYGLKGVLFYAMLYVFCNTGAFAVATAVETDTGSTDR
ncbi:MAG: NADH-quinone oxidoreductase subunit N, partial [Syntrophomonadaceae bacterium]|nr:NADH-quinone oxidoreductase subunit N [Syntrophomonadaceae bacterium]